MALSASRPPKDPSATRRRLVDATVRLMRRQGFAATGVDGICAEAGVTKGAFFHHFGSKEEAGVAALDAWCFGRVERYVRDLGSVEDPPLIRLGRLLDGLVDSIRQPDEPAVCLLGMISQEMGGWHESMRTACEGRFRGWTAFVAGLLAEAKAAHPPRVDFDPVEIAWMLNGLWQGSLILAKTCRDVELAAANLRHARNYISNLFGASPAGN